MLTPRKLQSRPMRRKVKEPSYVHERHPQALRPLAVAPNYARCGSGVAAPKSRAPVRDEGYRRWVASLPCYECRIHGYSQAAHPNSGKAKGRKLSDAGCFPMCADRLGVKGCHARFDQYEIVSRADMPEYERRALEWTEQQKGLL